MTDSPTAAYSDRNEALPFADAAGGVFRHLGEASQRLMELQAQAAAIVLMDSAARYAEVMEGVMDTFGLPPQWTRVQRSQLRGVVGPLEAWMESATGLQAVLLAAFMQAWALTVFPNSSRPARHPKRKDRNRRFESIVIPFPDRRHDSGG